MINWFKRPEPKKEIVIQRPPSGFFSTDAQFDVPSYRDRFINAIKKSVQVTVEDHYKPVDANGNAMDSGDSLIQCAKIVNNSTGYLPIQQIEWYGGQGFIGWQTCAIISQNWLVDKVCGMPGDDAVRHGYDITVNSGEDIDPKLFDEMRKLDKKWEIKKKVREFIKKGRIFGIRHALFLVDSPDPLYYERPFNPDGVTRGSYKGIVQIDPYWIAPMLDDNAAANPMSPGFYEPTWWMLNGKKIHKSHFIIMRNGGELPDVLKPSYMYGGIPVPQKVYERVYASEKTANEAPMLAMTKRMTVLNIDTTKAFADPEAFSNIMNMWVTYQNNFGVKVADTEEKVSQFDTGLADLDSVIMTQYQLVAAAGNVPATKLLGTTPKGFNSSGEYEESSYHEELESIQENYASPLVERHHLLLVRSIIAPKHGIPPFNTEVTWKPVDSPTAAELAETNNKKADTDAKLIAAGSIDGFDSRQRLINDPDSGYSGIPDIVPGGVGDREAQQEKEAMMLEGVNDKETPDNAETKMGTSAEA